jgi:hypothetical protein
MLHRLSSSLSRRDEGNREVEVHKPLANTARVFLLLAVAVVLSVTPAWLPLAAALYLAFEVLLLLRPERSQI